MTCGSLADGFTPFPRVLSCRCDSSGAQRDGAHAGGCRSVGAPAVRPRHLDSGTLESTDTYSFTSDRSWIDHEWLSEIAIAGAWLAGGASGLILLKLVCILGALGFIGAALEEKGITGRARIMLLGLTLVGLLMRVTHVRPQLFSVLLFAALIYSPFARSAARSARCCGRFRFSCCGRTSTADGWSASARSALVRWRCAPVGDGKSEMGNRKWESESGQRTADIGHRRSEIGNREGSRGWCRF